MLMKLVLVASVVVLAQADDYIIKNCLGGAIWVGIQGNPNYAHLNNGGFVLDQNQEITISSNGKWAGRFWARTYCDAGSNHCETGDCGNKLECAGAGGTPPVSLAEINTDDNTNWYDISLVDGYNVPVSIEPVGGSDGECRKLSCSGSINEDCPDELKVTHDGTTIACKSACLAFGSPEYCCTGEHETPDTCPPFAYSQFFKERCPDAYSYAYDDATSLLTCHASTYKVQFGC